MVSLRGGTLVIAKLPQHVDNRFLEIAVSLPSPTRCTKILEWEKASNYAYTHTPGGDDDDSHHYVVFSVPPGSEKFIDAVFILKVWCECLAGR